MQELQIFNNGEFGKLGILEIDGKMWFPATACAKILDFSNPRKAILDHCRTKGVTKRYPLGEEKDDLLSDGVIKTDVLSNGGRQEMKFIDEGNLYRLIVRSRLPTAEKFERWVFDEVLPAIRKNGGYISNQDQFNNQIMSMVENLNNAVLQLADKINSNGKISGFDDRMKDAAIMMREGKRKTSSKIETLPNDLYVWVIKELANKTKGYRQISDCLFGAGYDISYASVFRYAKRIKYIKIVGDLYEVFIDGNTAIRIMGNDIIDTVSC